MTHVRLHAWFVTAAVAMSTICCAAGTESRSAQPATKPAGAGLTLKACSPPGVSGGARCGTYRVFEDRAAAVSDHVHPRLWWAPIPGFPAKAAATEMQTNAHGGEAGSAQAESNYGFLDGHAATHSFGELYRDKDSTNFVPDRVHAK